MRFVIRKLYYFPSDLLQSMTSKREKYEPPKGEIYIGSGDFIGQGKHQLQLLKHYIELQPSDVVLDIGSGIGRTAIPLTTFLNSEAKYEGFDVVEKGVKWCNSKIKTDFPNFNFQYIPLNNDLYNNSTNKASVFKFPYKNQKFSKAFLFSVFTHMMLPEIENYLQEIERVLKPGGMCLATFFIYDSKNEEEISTRKQFNFPVKKEGYRLMNADVKSANIAVNEAKFNEMLSTTNLKKVKSIDGYWKDHNLKAANIDFQDIVVLQKPD